MILGVCLAESLALCWWEVGQKSRHLVGRDALWQETGAVALAQQDQEVQVGREALTAGDLLEADRQRALFVARLGTHAPA